MSDLLEALQEFDGKAVTLLSEARARFGEHANFLGDLAALIDSLDAHVADGATWLIKDCLESGMSLKPKVVADIVKRLDGVPRWQAALHLCQAAEFLEMTPVQAKRYGAWASQYLDHKRPFLRAWSISALQFASHQAPSLTSLAKKALAAAEHDTSASVRARARQVRH